MKAQRGMLRGNGQLSRERPWPADRVERWPIERLIPHAKNARTHSPTQVDQIAASIREWGWTTPVLVDDDATIIAGHGRVLAARKLRIPEVPVMVAIGWTDAQKRAYAIADTKLALNGGWDEELLGLEFGDLELLGFDLSLTGFSDAERAALASHGTAGLTDPDDVPEPPAEPVSIPCDLWLLGKHRLVCGDSTVAADVKRVLGSVRSHLMVTDPPYGVDYDPAWRADANKGLERQDWRQGHGTSATTTRPTGPRHGSCFPAMLLMSGTAACAALSRPSAWRLPNSRSEARSSGTRAGW